MTTRTYSDLILLPTFLERYRYLRLGGNVGLETFGHNRYLNQILYTSDRWRSFRDKIIIRDNGCDLGLDGYEIRGKILIHHMNPIRQQDIYDRILVHHINPITVEDVLNENPKVFDPDNVICTSHNTHQAIHYGDENLLIIEPAERFRNDTCPWKR